jgi:hypothetical protein
MSGVFLNLDPHPLTARRVCTPSPLVPGEDARHYSVLYIRQNFVLRDILNTTEEKRYGIEEK